MHDVVSDILANPDVPRNRKRAEIMLAARRFRDDSSYVMTPQAWRTMSQHMGLENMGGPAVGFLAPLPTPTVSYGAVMEHDDRTGEMIGFKYGHATGGEHAGHAMAAPNAPNEPNARDATRDSTGRRADSTHAGHEPMAAGGGHETMHGDTMRHVGQDTRMRQMMELHERMLADPVIHERIMADTAMRRMVHGMMGDVTGGHAGMAGHAAHEATRSMTPAAKRGAAKPTSNRSPKPAKRKPAVTKPTRDPHAGHTP
jgi:hypothetical protein